MQRKRAKCIMALLKNTRPSLKYTITSDNNSLPIIYAGVQQRVKSYINRMLKC